MGACRREGLPTCDRSLSSASSAQALAACGDALVGTGQFAGRAALPDQDTFAVDGKIYAFNAVVNGHTAIYAQI